MITNELKVLNAIAQQYNIPQREMAKITGYSRQQGYNRAVKDMTRLTSEKLTKLEEMFTITTTIEIVPKQAFFDFIEQCNVKKKITI